MFAGPSPRWFSIAAHRPFVDDLAAGLAAGLPEPEALADAVVLTPTRRAAGALAQAFVRAAGGRAVLLPQIRAIGDLDEGEPPFEPGALTLELPAAIEPRRRRFELARLVHARQDLLGRRLDAAGAVELGDALSAFLDSCQLEEVATEAKVDGLVEGDLARHWQASAAFLAIALREEIIDSGYEPGDRISPKLLSRRMEVPRSSVDAALRRMVDDGLLDVMALRAGLAEILGRAGVTEVVHDPRCTVEDPQLFSHRRDGVTGRQAGLVWLG